MKEKYVLGVIMSHPIHYFLGLFKKVHKSGVIDEQIYFCSDFGIKAGLDHTFNKVIKWYDESILNGLNYTFLNNLFSFLNFGGFFSIVNISIFKKFKEINHDAVLLHSWNFFSNWFAFFSACFLKIPIFLRVESPYNQEIIKPKWKIFLKKFLLGKLLFPRISAFLYIGEQNRRFYDFYGVPSEKLFFVPYSVDNDFFQKQAALLCSKKDTIKENIGIAANQFIILFVGKLIEKKRPLDLLRAFHNAQLTGVTLVFVGDGPLRGDMEEYIANNNVQNVVLLGVKYPAEIAEFYSIADLFVLPSSNGETWGLVVNEAMNFGLPVIVSDVVGCGVDLVKHGENGFVFPVGDINKLSQYLMDIMCNSHKRESFGERSLEIVSGYDYEQDIQGIISAFRENISNT